MAKPILVLKEDGYLLKMGGKESDEVDYGTPVALAADGKNYVAYVNLGDDGEPETNLEGLVYCGDVVEPEIEDLISESGNADEDQDDDQDDDDDEEVEVTNKGESD